MLVLAIDSATPTVVAGVVDSDTDEVLGETILENCRDHNEQLVPATQAALNKAGKTFQDIHAIVVGTGPGPFTGLRVGMATAAAFGDALGIPVHGVCSLDAIAVQIPAEQKVVAIDARRREAYWARYEGERVGEPQVTPYDQVPRVGEMNAPANLAEHFPEATHDLYPTPLALVQVASLGEQPGPLQPLYLRRPDAKEPKPKPKSPAIPDVQL
ncbi:tRNA (adenosine(37)-N6)-threonylcarbamoyltransferase complex dimerization subunit type 1 TsaB [Corynebacterium epidermidicanis]|uniref:tRNA (adenosine(37)-N6)-threonylcarbamoyltransferase complex dimerization subunit type 1 TsaB n=1 Tax=Corynebacterium epidermidicanis TaxID=1050174 RepID=UPI000641838A|nr:tRNA (adenosine(37)-N6)-threonylcarbamoyltransferase complex dimerization subunit type 1 TsaB [Corynebacterium epidermidicanis]